LGQCRTGIGLGGGRAAWRWRRAWLGLGGGSKAWRWRRGGTWRWCDNTRSQPHPIGGKASQTVSSGSPVGEYPPRKESPKSTPARCRPGEGAPSDRPELCDRKYTFPRRRPRGDTHASPTETPLGPLPDGPPARSPPSSPGNHPTTDPPLKADGARLSEGRRSFWHRLEAGR